MNDEGDIDAFGTQSTEDRTGHTGAVGNGHHTNLGQIAVLDDTTDFDPLFLRFPSHLNLNKWNSRPDTPQLFGRFT
jgi:hypothetical protein